jgi:hypothetical protein
MPFLVIRLPHWTLVADECSTACGEPCEPCPDLGKSIQWSDSGELDLQPRYCAITPRHRRGPNSISSVKNTQSRESNSARQHLRDQPICWAAARFTLHDRLCTQNGSKSEGSNPDSGSLICWIYSLRNAHPVQSWPQPQPNRYLPVISPSLSVRWGELKGLTNTGNSVKNPTGFHVVTRLEVYAPCFEVNPLSSV